MFSVIVYCSHKEGVNCCNILLRFLGFYAPFCMTVFSGQTVLPHIKTEKRLCAQVAQDACDVTEKQALDTVPK